VYGDRQHDRSDGQARDAARGTHPARGRVPLEQDGQLADTTGGDQFGLVLAKGSKLTTPVTAAVDALRTDGTLTTLQKTWLSDSISAPVLS